MLTKNHLLVLILLAAIVWSAVLLVLGIQITWEYWKPFSITIFALTAACFIFDRWLWRCWIFKGWFVNCPNLHGTWKVLLKSSWIDPETKEQIAPINCIMTIRQTYSQFSARLFTLESSSYLVAHKIEKQNDGVFQLFGTYQNTPDISLRGKRSEIHYGALVLEVRGDPPKTLVGHYWTDRTTKGSLELSDRQSEILASYDEGATKFGFK